MNEWVEMWHEGIEKEGVTARIVKKTPGILCPCYNESTGYGNPLWHLDNPSEPDCDDECYLSSTEIVTDIKCFMIPKDSLKADNVDQIILDLIGKIEKYDYVYYGPNTYNIKELGEDGYIEYTNMKFRIKNVQRYDIREEPLAYIAVLELIQNV